jgi:putative oxidoreductase
MELGILLLRVVVGLTLAAHGAQKLFGWFGGHGIAGTAGLLEQLGFRPGRPYAYLAGCAEFCGGLSLALGVLTPVGVAATVGMMTTACVAAHLKNGFFNSDGGFEFPLVMATGAAATALSGPGPYALDRLLGFERAVELAPWGILVGLVAALLTLASRGLFVRGAQAQVSH